MDAIANHTFSKHFFTSREFVIVIHTFYHAMYSDLGFRLCGKKVHGPAAM